MHAVDQQTVEEETEHMKKMKMARARKPEAFVWIDNEVELLLRLTLDYKVSKLQETRTQAVVRHCCYETSQGSEVEGYRWRGDGAIDMESMRIQCPRENVRAALSDFSTQRPGFKKVCLQNL